MHLLYDSIRPCSLQSIKSKHACKLSNSVWGVESEWWSLLVCRAHVTWTWLIFIGVIGGQEVHAHAAHEAHPLPICNKGRPCSVAGILPPEEALRLSTVEDPVQTNPPVSFLSTASAQKDPKRRTLITRPTWKTKRGSTKIALMGRGSPRASQRV